MIGEVLSNKKISDKYYLMEFICPELTEEVKPGQFLMLKVREGYEPYLRRPFSFHGIKYSEGLTSFEILYKVVGKGTRIMADMESGEKIDIIAPLGNGFSPPSDIRTAIIIAGGIGIAPLLLLAEGINKSRKDKAEIIFLYGGESKEDIVELNRIRDISSEIRICTEDGSMGGRMLVSELLEAYLNEREKSKFDHRSSVIFSCGPKEMLKSVSAISKRFNIRCEVSLESYMACGFGACLVCVAKVLSDDSTGMAYERVCKEGPVFNSERIIWDD